MASVQNKSSRDIKLKYCLYRKNSYFANKKRKLETKDILKEEGEAIPQSVTRESPRSSPSLPPSSN